MIDHKKRSGARCHDHSAPNSQIAQAILSSIQPKNRDWFIQNFMLSTRYVSKNGARSMLDAHSTFTQTEHKKAAVFLALVERNDALFLLLTKRAQHLAQFPGQICFPGGKEEKSDHDFIETALRETQEEVGITATREQVLGSLQPIATHSGYLIYPVLGFIPPHYKAKLDPNEVASLFELPLDILINPQTLKSISVSIQNSPHPIYALHYQNHLIWGATAQILRALSKQLLTV
ncbi:MAG: CoA pyrophosphatase [Vibrionaceae bacterium]